MLFSISVDHGPKFLQITCVGPATVADWFGIFGLAAAVASRSGETRILIDMLGVDFEFSPEQRDEIGSHGARVLSGFERVASVIPRALYTGRAEDTAQRHGLEVQSFADLEPAMKWVAE
jgi:hypothetical protein